MRRVVVTGMGIVSSIGNTPRRCWHRCARRNPASRAPTSTPNWASGARFTAQPSSSTGKAMVPRKPKRFMNEGMAWNYIAMDQAIRDAGLEAGTISNERTGIIMGSGGPSVVAIVEAAETTVKSGGPKKIGPFEVPKAMCSGPSGVLATAFQVKGTNYSISSACATSAHCIGNATELIQWGKQDVMFAGGCEELDWTALEPVRRHGRDVDATSMTGRRRPPRLRQEPRRLRHRRRRRRRGARGAGARQGARRQDLCRDRRLRRDVGRLRHGRALGRGCGALHADGARRASTARASARSTTSTHTRRPRRSATRARSRPSARSSANDAADRLDQVADRPFARRHRRAGSDLLAADDEERLHLRERQHRGTRPGCSQTCPSFVSARTMTFRLTVSSRIASVLAALMPLWRSAATGWLIPVSTVWAGFTRVRDALKHHLEACGLNDRDGWRR